MNSNFLLRERYGATRRLGEEGASCNFSLWLTNEQKGGLFTNTENLRIEPTFLPTFGNPLVENALVTAEWFLNPEFNPLGHDAKS